MLVTESGITREVIWLPLKAELPMLVTESGITREVNLELAKLLLPMLVIALPRFSSVRLVNPVNTELPIEVIFSPNVSVSKLLHSVSLKCNPLYAVKLDSRQSTPTL